MEILTAVSNSGDSIFFLVKSDAYDGLYVADEWEKIKPKINQYVLDGDLESYLKEIESFLGGLEKYGALFISRTN